MVVKRRLLLSVASALALVMTASVPMLGASREAAPSPLRQTGLLRVKDIAANGNTSDGAIVAVGWHEASKPGQLYLAFSIKGGKDYRRTNGNLRRYRIVGEPSLGMSLAICDGRVWAGSSYKDSADGTSRVLMTSRTIGGGAAQAWMTPADGRRVRDVSVACAGKDLLAISWLEKKDGQNRARLMLRSMEPLGQNPAIEKKYKFGPADYKGGIAVAATPEAVSVAYSNAGNLRLKRFGIDADDASVITQGPSSIVAWRDVKKPAMASRGNKLVVAYSDAGKVKAKLSTDLGASFGSPVVLVSAGSIKRPSKAYSADVIGDRIVFEVGANKKGKVTPQRIQSTDAGGTWGTRTYGHIGARVGALLKKKGQAPLLMEAWHNNAPKPSPDTLRARYELP
ncbi:MAG: hypothetical protein U9O18_09885 [Chloroflexota bacterium]|nr:hypothetical protein [Chloroflexota bacterium]